MALSAFIHAMFETNTVAVARYAYDKRSSPRLVALIPKIKVGKEVNPLSNYQYLGKYNVSLSNLQRLIQIQLPFADDLRHYYFPSLEVNKKFTPTGNDRFLLFCLLTY